MKSKEDNIFDKILKENNHLEEGYDDETLTVGELIKKLQEFPEDAEVQLVCIKQSVCGSSCEGSGYAKTVHSESGHVNIVAYKKGYMG